MKELLKKIRKYDIKIRKAINAHMQGDFHSIFKGSGLEFDDVRAYQYGDDIRTIDWNASAKGHGTFVKTFKEEKEQIVFFIIDVSASQEIGKPGQQKIDISKEICGILAFSAVKEGSQVGLICFSDQKEKYVKPGKGVKHAYQVLTNLYNLQPTSLQTNLAKAIDFSLNIIKRKSVVILISDFIDEGYEHNLKALSKKHDLVVIHINDKRETELPSLGIVPLLEKETKKTIWVNTASLDFRKNIAARYIGNQTKLATFCLKHQANYLSIRTDEDYVPKLIKLFNVRNKRMKSA
ncbi:MAG: DUF58 domain-containing protein [Bacteroidetes bacterium]|nr:DUF58 domain-containing protein [Bacteroidota bacterium]